MDGGTAAVIITDAQIHIWEAERPGRAWDPQEAGGAPFAPAAGARPHREEPVGAETMTAAMDEAGVDRAVIVPPSRVGYDNLTALESAARYPARFTVMGRFDPTAEGARSRLRTWLSQPGMSGIRMTFHKPRWLAWLDTGAIDWFWADCERLDIPLMLLIPGRMDAVARVAQRHPGLTLIVDHMGAHSSLRDEASFRDLDDVVALARLPRVCIKATAAPCYTNDVYPFAALRPHLERIFDSFGPHRMFWGSDFSRLPCSYLQCVDHFLHELDFLRGEDRILVMGRALSETLRWPEVAGEQPA